MHAGFVGLVLFKVSLSKYAGVGAETNDWKFEYIIYEKNMSNACLCIILPTTASAASAASAYGTAEVRLNVKEAKRSNIRNPRRFVSFVSHSAIVIAFLVVRR